MCVILVEENFKIEKVNIVQLIVRYWIFLAKFFDIQNDVLKKNGTLKTV